MVDKDGPSGDSPQQLESGQAAAQVLLRNSTAYLLTDLIIKLLSFVFQIFVVRQLGVDKFGLYSTVVAYVGIFSIISDLGMTQYVGREIARGRRKADDLFWNVVFVRISLAIIATIFITWSAAFLAGYEADKVLGVFVGCLAFFPYAFFGAINVILVGRERVDYASILGVIVQFFFISFGTLVLVIGLTYHWLVVASYLGVPVAAWVGAWYVKRLKLATLKFSIDFYEWWPLLKFSLPFAMITFTLLAAKDFDTVLLSLWYDDEVVGIYKPAYNLIYKLLFIKTALLTTLSPQMARYYGVSKNRVAKTFNTSFKILWSFSLPIAIGSMILAYPMTILLYGEEFRESALVLAILIWALPFLNLSSLCGSITTATDKEKKAAKVYFIAAVVNLSTNLVAIPYWSYIGAAVSTVITEIITLVLFYSLLHEEFPLTDLSNTLIKPTVAGIIMGLIVLGLHNWPLLLTLQDWHIFIAIPIGALVYIILLLLFKPFTKAELDVMGGLWKSVQRRLNWGTSS